MKQSKWYQISALFLIYANILAEKGKKKNGTAIWSPHSKIWFIKSDLILFISSYHYYAVPVVDCERLLTVLHAVHLNAVRAYTVLAGQQL